MVMMPAGVQSSPAMFGLQYGQNQLTGQEAQAYELQRSLTNLKEPRVLTAEEAQLLGIDLSQPTTDSTGMEVAAPDDWADYLVRLTPNRAAASGFDISVISPDNYEFRQDGSILTPEGKSYSAEEWAGLSTQQAGQQVQLQPPEGNNVQLLTGEYVDAAIYNALPYEEKQYLGTYGVAAFNARNASNIQTAISNRAELTSLWYQAVNAPLPDFQVMTPGGTDRAGRFMALTRSDWWKQVTQAKPEEIPDKLIAWQQADPASFVEAMTLLGRNAKTEALVRNLYPTIDEDTLAGIFGEPGPSGWTFPISMSDGTEMPARLMPDQSVNIEYAGEQVSIGTFDVKTQVFTPNLEELGFLQRQEDIEAATRYGILERVSRKVEAGFGHMMTGMAGFLDSLTEGATPEEAKTYGYMSAFAFPIAIASQFLHNEGGKWESHGVGIEGMPYQIVEQLPMTVSLGVAAYFTGGAVAGVVGSAAGAAGVSTGMGAFASEVSLVLGAAVSNRAMEAALEAGDAYNAAIAQGMTESEASGVANQVFNRNVRDLTAFDIVEWAAFHGLGKSVNFVRLQQLGVLVAKTPRVVRIGGKVALTAFTEGGEEYYQEIIQRQALGEDIDTWALKHNLSQEDIRQIVLIGAIMGAGFGTVGEVVQSIDQNVVPNLSPEMLQAFNAKKAEFVRQGMPVKQADLEAKNWLATQAGGKETIAQVGKAAQMQARLKAVNAKSEADTRRIISKAEGVAPTVTGIEYRLANEGTENRNVNQGGKEPWQMTREELGKEGTVSYRGQTGMPFSTDIESGRYPGIVHSTPNEQVAGIYAEGQRGSVKKLVSKPKNVLDLSNEGTLTGSDEILMTIARRLGRERLSGNELAGALKQAGYDGVRFKEAIPGRHVSTETLAVLSEIADHESVVRQALAEGKPVPQEVLAEYPDLAKAAPAKTAAETPPKPPKKPSKAKAPPPKQPPVPAHEEKPPSGKPPKSLEGRQAVLDVSKAMIAANGTNAITKVVARTPGLGHVIRFVKAKIDLDPKVHLAMVAQVRAQSYVQHMLFTGEANCEAALVDAFGKKAIYKPDTKAENVKYVGPEDNPYQGMVKDICDNPQFYKLTPKQQKAIDMLAEHGDYGLQLVNDGFVELDKNNMHRYPYRPGGAFLSTVDVGEDVVEYLGSETRAVSVGRGKTRVYPSAYERWQHSQKTGQAFTPETSVALLIRGQDAHKARFAGNEVFRHALGGKTKLEVLTETHPELAAKMEALKKRLGKLQGYKRILTEQQQEAIQTFLESDGETADLDALSAGLEPELEAGRYVAKAQAGKSLDTIMAEIQETRQAIRDLRPAWESANLKPYVLVKEGGIWRYFDAKVAPQVIESLKVSTNFFVDILDQTRRITFGLDGSPISIQGQIAALFDPVAMVRITGRQFVESAQARSPFYAFSREYVADMIAAHSQEAAEFAMIEGIPMGTTFEEFNLGWAEKLPIVGKGIKVINDSLFTWLRLCKFQMWMQNSQHLTNVGYEPMVAKVSAHAVMNGVFPMADRTLEGQSQARAKALRALPTSYSFLMEPAKLMGEAVQGYAKIATRQTLTPRERLSVEMMTRMAATTAFVSVMSAALSGLAQGKDWDEIENDMWMAVFPHPRNGRFMSIIIGDYRIPLGGPYRALFKAMLPDEVEGVPFRVPFAGLYNFFKNRQNPFLGTQIDLIRNKDWTDQPILQGGWPSKFAQFLEYEIEGTVPLSLGGVLEDIRTDKAYRIVQDLISGMVGVNTINMDDTYFNRMWRRLGQPDTDGTVYNTKDLWGDVARYAKEPGFGKQEVWVGRLVEAAKAKDEMETNLAQPLYQYDDWQEKYERGEIGEKEYNLLQQYHDLLTDADRKQFRDAHPEISTDARDEWLKSHYYENALLTVWGKAKPMTIEAYNRAIELMDEMQVPEAARPEMVPPEIAKDYYQYKVDYDTMTNIQRKLYRLQHPELNTYITQPGNKLHNETDIKETEAELKLADEIESGKYADLNIAFQDLDGNDATAHLIENPEFATAHYQLSGYDKGLSEEWVDEYADYMVATQLTGTDRKTYLADHQEFFNAVKGTLGWQDIDFAGKPETPTTPETPKPPETPETPKPPAKPTAYADIARQAGYAEQWIDAYVQFRTALDAGYTKREYLFKHQDLYRYMLSLGEIDEINFTRGPHVRVAGVPLRMSA